MSSTAPTRDRRQLLLGAEPKWNGIDYIEVAENQTQLSVHFLNQVTVKATLTGDPPVTITGGEVVTSVAVNPIDESTDWSADSEGRPILALSVPAPGDFSTYTLTITTPPGAAGPVPSTSLDPFFQSVPFSFKANCPTTLDCATPVATCPDPVSEAVTIDYLAKDFASFSQALSEFSTLRYPGWVERSEADLGMVLMESLAAMADELSYLQDRVAAESTIETATQRLSVLRHARLVDYEPAPATVATTLLQLQVSAAGTGDTPGGLLDTPLQCRAVVASGSVVEFEVGAGLVDPSSGGANAAAYPVDSRWNRDSLVAYYWDDSTRCLASGATALYLIGHDLGLYAGQQLLLDSPAADTADPPIRELVTVAGVAETSDPVLTATPVPLTQITLAAPTTADHDLYAVAVAGNLVPAVQGTRQTDTFVIPGGTPVTTTVAPAPVVVRLGANWTPEDPLPDYRYTLASDPLAWIAAATDDEDTAVPALPELLLGEVTDAAGTTVPWLWERWLLDAHAADRAFTLTPERYSPVLTSSGTTWWDYDGDDATTVRFGDGTFGITPPAGTVFTVLYRTGGGSAGNVPADTIVSIVAGQAQGPLVTGCTNPFAATGGADAETLQQIRDRAPQKFSTEPLRVVVPGDYVAAATSLPWVQQAGTTFRWTGSWLTVLTSADPVGLEEPTVADLESLTARLQRRRLAGYESYVLPPRYVAVDLQITVCSEPTNFNSDVAAAVLARLRPGPGAGGTAGFFDHSRWSFGQPLESSALLSAIQGCAGVDGVYSVQFRQRGVQLDWAPLPETLSFASDQILRVDNDPSRPEAGSMQVTVTGGK